MASVVATAHQPAYLPWIGYFARLLEADVFVLLDHVQYEQRGWQNRNLIRAADGPLMLTVPVRTRGRSGQALVDVELAPTQRWQRSHWRTLLHNYRSSPHFDGYRELFEPVYLNRSWRRLADLNSTLIAQITEALAIEIPVLRSSDMDLVGRKTEMIAEMCARIGATAILTGEGARSYLEPAVLARHGVQHRVSSFRHPSYSQRYKPFLQNMSIVDLMFNCGPAARNAVRNSVDAGKLRGSVDAQHGEATPAA